LLKKNHDIVKNNIKKYEKFWSQNYIKFYDPKAIKDIFNKLNVKNHVEEWLETERIVVVCIRICGWIKNWVLWKYLKIHLL